MSSLWSAVSTALVITLLSPHVSAQSGQMGVSELCGKIGRKLSSVSVAECSDLNFAAPRFYSVAGKPLLEKHFPAALEAVDPTRILFIGGIHGDEYSSVSVSFKWLNKLARQHDGRSEWWFVPLANPDGLLQRRSTRVNANKVDLNRNFTPDGAAITPLEYWKQRKAKRLRYYPGHAPLSEPESRMIHQLIDEFKPHAIVSVHAPHGILDFDGDTPPNRLGSRELRRLGTYPGSLGNYSWFIRNIPVMTIELSSAGRMPAKSEINAMWQDLLVWVDTKSVRRAERRKESELVSR